MSEIPHRLRDALADRYEIGEELGAGGMATVYLANDLRHDRRVAIKVLRPELAAVIGGERFIAEIRTTASLQHPHILPLFDSGEADRFLYYVMPYVEGESLRDRLDRDRQLPVEEAIRIARAVGSALHYAHERGIVHRDIKPANILLHAGEPVVADFGIAIAISAAGGGRLTETGMSVGTPHYMSPEQAAADRDVDARSDTYALACVLYEMLAGQPPHTGPTAQAVLMRILTETPRDITDVRRSVPTHVRDALAKGLEKLPADRFPTSKAFADAIDDPAFRYAPSSAGTAAQKRREVGTAPGRRASVAAVLPIAAALAGGLVIGGVFFGGDGAVGPEGSARFDLHFPPAFALDDLPAVIHISPDGRWLGFVGDNIETGADGIFVRGIDEFDFRYLPGTEDVEFMWFSPDGNSIVYSDPAGALHVLPSSGGAAREIASAAPATRILPRWSEDGWIHFIEMDDDGVFVGRVPEGGGAPEEVVRVEGNFAVWPRSLPDGSVLFIDVDLRAVYVGDSDGGPARELIADALAAEVVLDGEAILYVDLEGTLWGSGFDARRNELVGDPIPLVVGLTISEGVIPALSLSREGTLVYTSGSAGRRPLWDQELAILGFDGSRTEVPIQPRSYRNVRWSPDGTSIAFAALEPGEISGLTSIYTYNVELRTATRRLTEGLEAFPVWSPEGDRLAFLSAERSSGDDPSGMGALLAGDLEVMDLETGDRRVLADGPGSDVPYAWSGAGDVVFTGGRNVLTSDLLVVRPDDGDARSTYLDIDGDLGAVTLSPDGRWAAFRTSREDGEDVHIAVRSFPRAGPPIRLSEGWGDRPRWSADGEAIYYWRATSAVDSLMRATVRTEPDFEILSTEVVLSGEFAGIETWDLHPDGDRIVIAVPLEEEEPETESSETPNRHLVVVNWLAEVRAALGLRE